MSAINIIYYVYIVICDIMYCILTLPLIVGGLLEESPTLLVLHHEPSRQRSASYDNYVWLLKIFRYPLVSAAAPVDAMHANKQRNALDTQYIS